MADVATYDWQLQDHRPSHAEGFARKTCLFQRAVVLVPPIIYDGRCVPACTVTTSVSTCITPKTCRSAASWLVFYEDFLTRPCSRPITFHLLAASVQLAFQRVLERLCLPACPLACCRDEGLGKFNRGLGHFGSILAASWLRLASTACAPPKSSKPFGRILSLSLKTPKFNRGRFAKRRKLIEQLFVPTECCTRS